MKWAVAGMATVAAAGLGGLALAHMTRAPEVSLVREIVLERQVRQVEHATERPQRAKKTERPQPAKKKAARNARAARPQRHVAAPATRRTSGARPVHISPVPAGDYRDNDEGDDGGGGGDGDD